MGPIYENLIQDVVNEAVTKTLDEDETVQKLKRSHRIKEKQNKDTLFQSLSKERGRKWSNLNRCSFSDSEENCTPKSMEHEVEHFIPLKMKHKWNRIVSPCSSKSTTSCCESFIFDDIPIDLGLIDDPGDGLEPLDQKRKKKKTKGKGQKQKNKETGEDASRKDTSEKKQKRKEGKHLEQEASCTKSVVSVTLPEVDNDMDEEVVSIMEGNPKVTEDDVSAAKALVRLQSSRCSSLVQTDTEGTEK